MQMLIYAIIQPDNMARAKVTNEVLDEWVGQHPELQIHKENYPLLTVLYFENRVSTEIEDWQDGAKIEIEVLISALYEKVLTLCKGCFKSLNRCQCGMKESIEFNADSYGAVATKYKGSNSAEASVTVQFNPFKKGNRPTLKIGAMYKILGIMGSFTSKDKDSKEDVVRKQIEIREYTETKAGFDMKDEDATANKTGTVPLDITEGVKRLMYINKATGKIPIVQFKSAVGNFQDLVLKTNGLKIEGEYVVEDIIEDGSSS